MSIKIIYNPEFKSKLKQLYKKYKSIRDDIEPIIKTLQQGELLGNRIQYNANIVYKVRVKNSNSKKGKSGGYRIIYYLQTPSDIILLTIYSKSEQSDISVTEIKRLIAQSTH